MQAITGVERMDTARTARTVPHDSSNPHHVRLARLSERPFRASDGHDRTSDVSCFAATVALFDTVGIDLIERYVDRLQSYANEIAVLGSAVNYVAADEVGGLELVGVLRRHGLLSSPFRVENQRLKMCAHDLHAYMHRLGDAKRAKVCRELEMCIQLLR